MCGIAGIFGDCEGADRRVVEAVNAIRHRGPDEISFHNEDSCHLGIARLSIVDVENGHQPSYNEDHSII